MQKLVYIDEAAPQFRKTEAAFRYWLAQKDCPLKAAKIGGRLMLRQEDIDRVIAESFEATA